MAEYVKGRPEDRADILDFGNYVFSQAHRPHDFSTLLPKAYGPGHDTTAYHYLAKENGRIRGMVCCLPMEQEVAGRALRFGLVGTVSVHPYARGEGHMKRVMADMLADTRASGVDALYLGGQRQRYNHFGFEVGGYGLNYTLSQASIRHTCGDVDASRVTFREITDNADPLLDPLFELYSRQIVTGARPRAGYLDIMHSWDGHFYAAMEGDRLLGSLYTGQEASDMGEILLFDEADLPKLCKAWIEGRDVRYASVPTAPWMPERARALDRIAEGCSIQANLHINVFHWQKLLDAYFALKAAYAPLEPGEALVRVDEETLRFVVDEAGARVEPAEGEPELVLSHLEAVRTLFAPAAFCLPGPACLRNWAPLPLFQFSPDHF